MEFVDPYLRAELDYRRAALMRSWQAPMRLPFSRSRRTKGPATPGRRVAVAR